MNINRRDSNFRTRYKQKMNVDWKVCLGPNSLIPHDVFFTFPNQEGAEDVGAHKVLLGQASEVFHGQFYGPMRGDKDVIAVVDTTREAFNIVVEFIYSKAPDYEKFISFELLFEVFRVADFYLLDQLTKSVEDAVRNIQVTEDIFEELSGCAEENDNSGLAPVVLETCATFLNKNFGSYERILEFVDQYKGDSGTFLKIMRLVKKNKNLVGGLACSFEKTGFEFADHEGYYTCDDCWSFYEEEEQPSTICKFCITKCHSGHRISGPHSDVFFCDCGAGLLRREILCEVKCGKS